MFTGIIEDLGQIVSIEKEGNNIHFSVKSALTKELKIDQSVSHNGVCLTVININDDVYTVTAIKETLAKTNLGDLTIGSLVNLERAMSASSRFDGHIVQGHVDQTGVCKSIKEENGSWMFTITHETKDHITVEKGSITINGVSLTVVDAQRTQFSVCIIPYTFEHTTFKTLKAGNTVNLEFDIIGKYVERLLAYRK
ncbi:MAG: riboflavin synthase [Flavobacteriales bacterium]|nr:riboflavin synthase [Flavobacteriales bacterium]MCW8912506.1 riboflavin synthase [Flavobacteriales bacterium]MCW8936590.1 riboflavin synthase [Flavobacteriales bacterium]MCW8940671.1 riboflavin synthase [Flavobacteriales bacterium]MCW8969148.1 riboflavin synthase [Flavobacteriales bacterium]